VQTPKWSLARNKIHQARNASQLLAYMRAKALSPEGPERERSETIRHENKRIVTLRKENSAAGGPPAADVIR